MKKFFAAMITVCLSLALCSSAMAQGGFRGANGHPGPAPKAVQHQPGPAHQPGPGHHPAARPGARHYAGPGHHPGARQLPPPPPPRHSRPAPPPQTRPYVRPANILPRTGIYIGGEHFGITIAL